MSEAVALDLVDAETVALSLEEGEQVALSFTEEVVLFEVIGEVGAQGPRGWAGTMAVGEVTTGTPGTDAAIENVGTVHDAILDFDIPRGDVGPQGIQGDEGTAATITVGDVTTGAPGTDAEIVNTGTSLDAVFDFDIPRGDKGEAATVTVGDTSTGAPGTDAAVMNTGDQYAAVLDFDIPRGDVGPQGDQGIQGLKGDKGDAATIAVGDVAASPPGSEPSVTNTGTSGDAVLDFVFPRGDSGPQGDQGIQGLKGDQGEAATIAVGDVNPSAAGSMPSVTNTGTANDAVFDFVLPRGDTGPQGAPGLDTGFYRHNQGGPSTHWVIQHNLGFYPAVTVQDSAGSVVYGDVVYVDVNNVTITFDSAFGGYANLS